MIHAITDGRDTSPTGAADYLAMVAAQTRRAGARIATVIGRYYAMDRDQRWDRNKVRLGRDRSWAWRSIRPSACRRGRGGLYARDPRR